MKLITTQIGANVHVDNVRHVPSQIKITPREQQILELLAQDFTSNELAQLLHISSETVKSHRRSLNHKFGVRTTGGLINEAFYGGILQIPMSTQKNENAQC